jgi:hypothetical protein
VAAKGGATSFETMKVRPRRLVHCGHSGQINLDREVPMLKGFATGVFEELQILGG